jgi:predicted nucleic acid-binding protein
VKVSAVLKDVQHLFVETAPFIYFTEKRPIYVDKMRTIFRYADAKSLDVITSVITLTECLTKPLKEGDSALVNAYELLLRDTPGITLMPISQRIASEAAQLRAKYNLRTPDALHIATATVSGCDAFLTNDFGLKRVTEVQILVLDELELSDMQTS